MLRMGNQKKKKKKELNQVQHYQLLTFGTTKKHGNLTCGGEPFQLLLCVLSSDEW